MGRAFNVLVRALTRLPFHDTQCGFKLMRRLEVLPLFRAALAKFIERRVQRL